MTLDWDPSPKEVQAKTGGLLERAVAVSCGLQHTCAIVQGGVAACWGKNSVGQLGVPGGRDASANRDLVEPRAVASNLSRGGAVSVAGGNDCSCVAIDGTPSSVQCVGSNAANQLGGTPPDSGVPVAMPLPPNAQKPRSVVASFYASSHILTVDEAQNVFGSGNNDQGALGAFASAQPAAVPGLSNGNVVAVATGPLHTCAILEGGTVHCLGRNSFGQLGRGYKNDRDYDPKPALAPGPAGTDAGDGTTLTNAVEVSVGYAQTCALVQNACRTDGTVYCWGFNVVGEIGDGTYVDRTRPTAVLAPP